MDNVQNSFFAKIVLFQKLIRLIFISLVSVPYLNSFTYDLGTLYSSVPGPNIIVTATPSNGGDVIVSVPIMIIEDPIFDPIIEDPIIEDPIFDPIIEEPYMPSYSIAEVKATINEGFNFVHWKVNGQVIDGTQIGNEITLYLYYYTEQPDFTLDMVYENSDIYVEAVFVEKVSDSRELDSVEKRLVATGQFIDNGDGTVSPKSNLTIKYNHKGNNALEIVEDPDPSQPSFPSISDLIGKQIEIVEDGFYFTHPGKIYFKNQDFADIGVEYKGLIEDVNYVIFSENIFAIGNIEPFLNLFVLNFNNDHSGTYKQYGDVSNIDEIPNLAPIGTGVFTIAENGQFVKTSDWEYSEFFDESLDLDRWGLTHRLTDDITVQNGDIGFAFSSEFSGGSDLVYLRLLPESKSWSVQLKDINIINNAGGLDLNLLNGIDYSYTMRIGSDGILRIYIDDEIGYNLLDISAYKQLGTTQNIDLKISYDKDLNEIIFEYSEAGIFYEVARFDPELAFLDLLDSNFSRDNLAVENYTPNNTSDSFSFFINVDSDQATNNEITIGSIIINNKELTPQANLSDLFGKQLELKPIGRDSIKNHSIQMILNADGTSVYGIKNSIFENRDFTQINDNSFIWWERQLELEYEEDGSIILNAYFIPDANDGNQELVLDEIFSVTITDNSLQNYIDWEYQELFDSNEIDGKWSISRRLIDDISISQGNASFIFGEVDNLEPYEIETEMLYTRVIPETENWTAKLSDINILNGGANVELFVTCPDRTLDTGLYLYKNNVIRIDVFHYDDYSIYIEKGISDTRDLNFDISFDQNLQSIIYKYGKLDDLNEVARFNFDTGQLIIIDDGFNIEYEEGSPISRNSTGAGFILGIDAEDVTKESSRGDITVGSFSISRLNSEEIDSDGDGVPDSEDAFPNDPNEWLDTDNDDVGNNADTDDDNDLLLDSKESQLGSDPLVADNFESLIPIINQLDLLSSMQDLRPGSTMIEIHDGQATLTMEVEESDDLGVWTNGSATSIQIPIDAEAGKKFFRFKMAE